MNQPEQNNSLDQQVLSENVSQELPVIVRRANFGAIAQEARAYPELVAGYTVFQEILHPEAATVYYPCSGLDISPSNAFPDSRVIYVEHDRTAVEALEAAAQEVYDDDATTFDTGPVDVLILRNPAIDPTGPLSLLKVKGYALVNDYHGTASALHVDENYKLIGILHNRTPDNRTVLDTVRPEDYWREVETDEEFRGAFGYEGLAIVTKAVTGTGTPSLAQYRQAEERVRQEYPNAKQVGDFLMYDHDGATHVFPIKLPPKKGAIDDSFVFQRIA